LSTAPNGFWATSYIQFEPLKLVQIDLKLCRVRPRTTENVLELQSAVVAQKVLMNGPQLLDLFKQLVNLVHSLCFAAVRHCSLFLCYAPVDVPLASWSPPRCCSSSSARLAHPWVQHPPKSLCVDDTSSASVCFA